MAHQLYSDAFYCLMIAQALGAMLSCSCAWHCAGSDEDGGNGGQRVKASAAPIVRTAYGAPCGMVGIRA
jgi:hypothetical protein